MIYDKHVLAALDVVADLRAEGYTVRYRIRKTSNNKHRIFLYVQGDEHHGLKQAECMIKYALPNMSIRPSSGDRFYWTFSETNK